MALNIGRGIYLTKRWVTLRIHFRHAGQYLPRTVGRDVVNRDTTAFSTVLRQLRTAAALSQEELASRSGLSLRGISDLERGADRNGSTRYASIRISESLT